jgi:predicted SAM-dependent methyltransferase
MKRKLHIGGKQRATGWEVLNANPAPYVDHVCNATDLSQFADGTFSEIYASHVIEHFDYQSEMVSTLKGFWRVMEPGGIIYISVPDLDVLAALLLKKGTYTTDQRFLIMRMIFGGHVDKYDYHLVGLNEDFLKMFLKMAGFINMKKVSRLGFFNDTSDMAFMGIPISLNVIAKKPG